MTLRKIIFAFIMLLKIIRLEKRDHFLGDHLEGGTTIQFLKCGFLTVVLGGLGGEEPQCSREFETVKLQCP